MQLGSRRDLDLRSNFDLDLSRSCYTWIQVHTGHAIHTSGLPHHHGMRQVDPVGALTREADLVPFEFRRRLLAAVAVEKHNRNIPRRPGATAAEARESPPLPPQARERVGQDRSGDQRRGGPRGSTERATPRHHQHQTMGDSTHPLSTSTRGLSRAVPRDAPPEERRRAAEETLSQLPPADVNASVRCSSWTGRRRLARRTVALESSSGAGAGRRRESRPQRAVSRRVTSRNYTLSTRRANTWKASPPPRRTGSNASESARTPSLR